jgi:hypothetical protein
MVLEQDRNLGRGSCQRQDVMPKIQTVYVEHVGYKCAQQLAKPACCAFARLTMAERQKVVTHAPAR